MRKTNIYYWTATGLLLLAVGVGSVLDAIAAPEAVKVVTGLGYPKYLVPFLGIAKLIGFSVILMPGYPRLKEWAYAGIAFDIIGALYSNIALHNPPGYLIFIVLALALMFASYVFHHKKLAMAVLQVD